MAAGANKGKSNGPSDVTYVKLGLMMVNEDLGTDKIYTLDDIKKPTPEIVQQILISALSRVYGHENFTNVPQQELANFNSHSLGPRLFVDATVDNIYRYVLKCVPKSSDMIDYSILLNPCGDLKRTYQLISYIVAFTLFCDRISENFEGVANELTNENQVKIDLCGEIEEIQEKCAAVEKKINDAKLEMPVVEATLQGLKDVVKSVEDEISFISEQMLQDQLKYDEIEKGNKKLESTITQLQNTIIALEDQVVASPEEILNEFETVKKTLEMAKTVRSQLSSKLDEESVRDQIIKNVIDMGERCVSTFEELVNKLNDEEEKLTEASAIARDIHQANRKIESIQETINEMTTTLLKLTEGETEESALHKEKIEQIQFDVQELTRTKEETLILLDVLKSQISDEQKRSDDLQCQLADVKTSNKDHEYYCNTTIVNISQSNRARFQRKMQNFNDSILAHNKQ